MVAAKKKTSRSRWESTSQEDRGRPRFSTTLSRETIATIGELAAIYGLRQSAVVEAAIRLLKEKQVRLADEIGKSHVTPRRRG